MSHVTVEHFNDQDTLVLIENCKNLTSLKMRNMLQWKNWQNQWGNDWACIAKKLAERTSFQTLELSDGCDFYREELAHIAKISQLRSISLCCESLNDDALEGFAEHPGLQEVRLTKLPGITDRTINLLSQLPELTSLDIRECEGLTSTCTQYLASAKKLSRLILCKFTQANKALYYLSNCLPLRSLRLLECAGINDKALKQVGKYLSLSNIEILKGDKAITNEGLRSLASDRLRHLQLLTPRRAKIDQLFAEKAAWGNITLTWVKEFVNSSPELLSLTLPVLESVKEREALKQEIASIRPRLKLTFA